MVIDSITKAHSVYSKDYKKVFVSVSGGSDSDVMIDICKKMDPYSIKTIYVWINTGLEYQATKEHLEYLEKRYGIKIEKIMAKMPIPLAITRYGQPFLSKQVSEFMYRLQLHDFGWEDESYDVLIKKYPTCKSALEWWCDEKGSGSKFSIRRNKYLKEFITCYPPTFKISNKCCQKSKKDTINSILGKTLADLDIVGIRKSEGGARSALKGCFVSGKHDYDVYRPLFWYNQDDKKDYETTYAIKHSRCYEEYGLCRTGCVGCPFSRDFEKELDVCKKYEPKLANACNHIFKDSYAYLRKYRKFVHDMNKCNNDTCKQRCVIADLRREYAEDSLSLILSNIKELNKKIS